VIEKVSGWGRFRGARGVRRVSRVYRGGRVLKRLTHFSPHRRVRGGNKGPRLGEENPASRLERTEKKSREEKKVSMEIFEY